MLSANGATVVLVDLEWSHALFPNLLTGDIGVSVANISELTWRTAVSAKCEAGACVEVAQLQGSYFFRDSKDPDGPVLTFTQSEWDAFVSGVRAGDFEFH